jgi:hypothetical protein
MIHDVLSAADRRSLLLHRAVVEKLRQRPELLARVRACLDRWAETDPDAYFVRGWREVLERPLDQVLSFLVDEGEWAADLRQSSPFTLHRQRAAHAPGTVGSAEKVGNK